MKLRPTAVQKSSLRTFNAKKTADKAHKTAKSSVDMESGDD